MRHVRFWWLVLLLLWGLPYLVLLVTGSIWLYQYGLLGWYVVASTVVTLASWWLWVWLRKRGQRRAAGEQLPPTPLVLPSPQPDPHWPPLAQQAWREVEQIARRVVRENLPLDEPQRIGQVLHEVLQAVARQYHPLAAQPELEIPLPHVLWTLERVARDLREAFSENIPGAHIFTLGDYWRLQRLRRWYRHFYTAYRLIALGWNPVSALLRELRGAATGQIMASSTEDLKQWAVGFCIRKAGLYAIELYSGQQEWDRTALRDFQTPESQRDLQRATHSAEETRSEPLRVMVVGQVKSGKSSVINALFGQVQAAVDVVPTTRSVTPYVLQGDALPRAIVLDTAGYESPESAARLADQLHQEALHCDLLLLVCSAVCAARDADRQWLDRLRAFFQQHPDRLMPPLVVALTHIDQLRPIHEWNPPYNLTHPASSKEMNIANATRAVTEDLALQPDQPVVPVCLRPGAEYNVDEGLWQAILQVLPKAQAAWALRSLRRFRQLTRWHRLRRQIQGGTRTLWKLGTAWLRRSAKG